MTLHCMLHATVCVRRYNGSGKTFMLGTWKTDYQIRDWTGVGTALKPHPNATTPILQDRLTHRYTQVLDRAKVLTKLAVGNYSW